MSQFYPVEDGVYTGSQIHTDPRLAPLRENVPKHRAGRTVIEIRGGHVVNKAMTDRNVVTFNTFNSSLAQELNRIGVTGNVHTDEDWLGQADKSKPESERIASLEATVQALRDSISEMAQSFSAKVELPPSLRPIMTFPSRTAIWKMKRYQLVELAAATEIADKANSMTRAELLSYLCAESDYRAGDLQAHERREAKSASADESDDKDGE